MTDWHLFLRSESLTTEARQELTELLLANSERAAALSIHFDNVDGVVKAQWKLLQLIYPEFVRLSDRLFAQPLQASALLDRLWTIWLPLARQLVLWRQGLNRPFIQGILGGQGTGKTTLTAVLRLILDYLGYPTLGFSLDDLYKTYAERQQLQMIDPRLRWRGPPGTHDVALGLQVLDQLRQGASGEAVVIPRFNKSAFSGLGNRTQPEPVKNIQIVLFEGWFVGARPIDPTCFDHAPEPILTVADRQFARDMNTRLQDYLPLWERLDRLMVLHPVDYRLSQQWRKQAEQQRIAAGGHGMGDQDLNQFVEYFWKALHPDLFITPLLANVDRVHLVMEIDANHTPIRLYRPGAEMPR